MSHCHQHPAVAETAWASVTMKMDQERIVIMYRANLGPSVVFGAFVCHNQYKAVQGSADSSDRVW